MDRVQEKVSQSKQGLQSVSLVKEDNTKVGLHWCSRLKTQSYTKQTGNSAGISNKPVNFKPREGVT